MAGIFLGYLLGFLVVIGSLHWVVGIGSQGVGGELALAAAVIVPLVPFLIGMGYSGRLRKVTGGPGGITVLFQEARREIKPVALEEDVYQVDAPPVEAALPDFTQYVDEFEDRSVLAFSLGRSPTTRDIDGFLTNMPKLRYVVFTDGFDEFQGLMRAEDFRAHYLTDREAMVDRIDSGEVLELEDVVTAKLQLGATNATALAAMEEHGLELIGVVDEGDGFYGVITQDAISRELLGGLFRHGES